MCGPGDLPLGALGAFDDRIAFTITTNEALTR